MLINYKRFDKDIPALYKTSYRNAGYDLFARLDNPVQIKPGNTASIPLNVSVEIPPEAVGLILQKPAITQKWGLRLTNGVVVIDSLNHDEWVADFTNASAVRCTVMPGDNICQVIFIPVLSCNLFVEEVEFLGDIGVD